MRSTVFFTLASMSRLLREVSSFRWSRIISTAVRPLPPISPMVNSPPIAGGSAEDNDQPGAPRFVKSSSSQAIVSTTTGGDMAIEYLLVTYPEQRAVLADGNRVGFTNHTFMLPTDEYLITLDGDGDD